MVLHHELISVFVRGRDRLIWLFGGRYR